MPKSLRNDSPRRRAILLLLLLALSVFCSHAAQVILHLKNGDRLTGRIVSESTNAVTLATPFFGNVPVPLGEINKREVLPESESATNNISKTVSNSTPPSTNAPSAAGPELKPGTKPLKPPLSPANPEATPIATTPHFWKHDIRFGLNTRYAAQDSQEIFILGKSTYAHPPFRHIIDASLKYATIEGVVSADSFSSSEKTEYQLTPKTYLFNLVAGGFDQVRHIRGQIDVGPGFGVELLKLTNFVWKSEMGFNFDQQFLRHDNQITAYSIRIAEIFAWRVWEKLTADAKIEIYPDLAKAGEYRLRLESNLRYPVSPHLSLNLDFIEMYDTRPAPDVSPHDTQIRSTIGVTF